MDKWTQANQEQAEGRFNRVELKHQYHSSSGQHRIVELDHAGFLKLSGEWTGYQQIAEYKPAINHEDIREAGRKWTYIAVTQYYLGSALEPDSIYKIEKTEFKSEKEPSHYDR